MRTKADEIARVLSKIEGATDLLTEKVTGQLYLTIEIDRPKIARYGLNVRDIQNLVEIAIAGKSASRFYEENKSFDITVRLPEGKPKLGGGHRESSGCGTRWSECSSQSVGEDLSFGGAGPDQSGRRPAANRHRAEHSRKRYREVCERSETEDSRKGETAFRILPDWGGQFENEQRAMAKLMIIGPVAIGLILLLLFATFRSIRLALLVTLNLPFALIGGVFSLWISGLYLSVPASVGFIVLFGVAVLNGVVLVSRIAQLHEEEGLELTEAILKGSENRLRPVLMTALIAIFSLMPMLYAEERVRKSRNHWLPWWWGDW